MKGIYISVPDNEFNFYMSVLERFKTATVIKTDEFEADVSTLHPWQMEELKKAIEFDNTNPNEGMEAKKFTKQLRKKLHV
jgi:hypothetical protein